MFQNAKETVQVAVRKPNKSQHTSLKTHTFSSIILRFYESKKKIPLILNKQTRVEAYSNFNVGLYVPLVRVKVSFYQNATNSAGKIGNGGPVGIISLPEGRQLLRRGSEPQPRQPSHMSSQVRVVYCQIKTCSSSGTTYVALPEAVLDGNT